MATTSSKDSTSKSQAHIADLLAHADIKLNGDRPWDIKVNDPQVFDMVLAKGSVGLGESYMAGYWDCDAIDEMVTRVLKSRIDEKVVSLRTMYFAFKARFFNNQTSSKVWKVGEQHYDAGNDLFKRMLDPYMVYTCGYWRDTDNLNQAQLNKLDLVCKKLDLKPGMRILDIGCGWGSFMRYAAENYGVECVGLTVSKEQVALGKEMCAGLPVEFKLQDYRDMTEKFDAVVSLGMFEHVGRKNYKTYFKKARECLKPGGLFLLHTIGGLLRNHAPDPWLDKYIFPGGEVPALGQIADDTQRLFVIEDVHNFGADYDRTLMAWHANFLKGWDEIKQNYNETFFRMWNFYLLICAATFRARSSQLWQVVLSPDGVEGGYQRPFV